MKIFQKILKNEIRDSGAIRAEIEKLTSSGQELEAGLPGLKETLKEARTELLAESLGASDRVNKAERAISESKNKIAAITDILKELNAALSKALEAETIKKQAEIKREIADIGKESAVIQQEALSHFSKAAVLINKLMGNERLDHNLNYEFFHRCGLSTELRSKIDAGTAGQEGPSLYTRREQLSRMSEQLSKKAIS